MIIDDEDLKILKWFLLLSKENSTSTWQIMKKLYSTGRDAEHMRIKRKIKKFIEHGLVFLDEETKEYILVTDNVNYKKMKYDGKPINSLCIFTDGSWSAYELH